MWYPFKALGSGERKRLMRAIAVLTLLSGIGIQLIDYPTHNDVAPFGQVSLQFAGSTDRAVEIVGSWADVLPFAGGSLGIDYLWMLSYCTLLMLGCAWVAARGKGSLWATIGAIGGLVAVLALVLDAIEGVFLFQILDDATSGFPGAVRVIAAIKFLSIGVAMSIWIVGGISTRTAD